MIDAQLVSTRQTVREVLAAAADLALGSRCAGCDSEPGTLCSACVEVLHGPALVGELVPVGRQGEVPVPEPGIGPPSAGAGGPMPFAATTRYEGVGRAAVIAHKERGRLALATPLGAALAVAVTAVLAVVDEMTQNPLHPGVVSGESPTGGEVVVVPAPSRRSASRRRGHDPMLRTARQAVRVLRRVGVPAAVVPALFYRRAVADQHDLGRAARFANVRGAIGVRNRCVPRLVGRSVVLVDDVVTTGATASEGWHALRRVGVTPIGIAAITAVRGFFADRSARR